MSRRLIAVAAAVAPAFAPGVARADGPGATAVETTEAPAPPEPPDQALAATIGAAGGGRVTPGGLRVGGRYLYRMSDDDWFEGVVAFTFGRGSAECFRDRDNVFLCDHGVADGFAGEIGGSIRRRILGTGRYQPFVRVGLAARISRFGADDVQGLVIPLTGAGGVRAEVSDTIAISAEAAVEVGIGFFNHDLGTEPQFGLAIAGIVEFAL